MTLPLFQSFVQLTCFITRESNMLPAYACRLAFPWLASIMPLSIHYLRIDESGRGCEHELRPRTNLLFAYAIYSPLPTLCALQGRPFGKPLIVAYSRPTLELVRHWHSSKASEYRKLGEK